MYMEIFSFIYQSNTFFHNPFKNFQLTSSKSNRDSCLLHRTVSFSFSAGFKFFQKKKIHYIN